MPIAACLGMDALVALLLLGYHPFAEDGGIYTAAIEARLDPASFAHDRPWVTAHTRFALFVPAVAAVTRLLHLPLPAMLFALHAAGLVVLLAAAAHLARTLFPSECRPWLSALIVAVGAGLPVAGTALYVMDPYCTARTLTTPLLLFALSFSLRERWLPCALCWAAAAAFHPLMGLWGGLPLLLAAAFATRRPRSWMLALTAGALAIAFLLDVMSPAEMPGTRLIAHTRAYWFPTQWRWYEWAGAAAPCVILAIAQRWYPRENNRVGRLASVAIATTALSTIIAICFARETAYSLVVARLQPMRSLQGIFLAFLVACGVLFQTRLRTGPQRIFALTACGIAALSVFAMQRSLYAHTRHMELPGTRLTNPWEQAFLWCRENTPSAALFALDANYINQAGEDSQGFRALSLRSALPDGVKDAGIAAVLPDLTQAWQAGVYATAGLNLRSDRERRERLLPLGVTWIVLPAASATILDCPFQNADVKVCRLTKP